MGNEKGSGKTIERRKVNREGRRLINLGEEMDWSIFNRCTKEDEKGEFTFMGEEETRL